jgi:hypothetical protein
LTEDPGADRRDEDFVEDLVPAITDWIEPGSRGQRTHEPTLLELGQHCVHRIHGTSAPINEIRDRNPTVLSLSVEDRLYELRLDAHGVVRMPRVPFPHQLLDRAASRVAAQRPPRAVCTRPGIGCARERDFAPSQPR